MLSFVQMRAFGDCCDDRAISQILRKVVTGQIPHCAPRFDRRAADVGQKHDVVHVFQGLWHFGFGFKYIQTRGTQFP